MIDLCIVVLNYATPKLVIDCLVTVVPQARKYDSRIVLVDNNSPDDSATILSHWIAEESMGDLVELVVNDENGGFSSGVNTGIRRCEARSYLLLNSDTLLRAGCVDLMMSALKQDSSVGLVAPRIESSEGGLQSHTFRDYTSVSEFFDTAGSARLMERFPQHTLLSWPFPSVTSEVSWSPFACILIRKDVFEDVGLMNEDYFLYFEDVDFCVQARRHNWRIVVQPQAEVIHFAGSSTKLDFDSAARRPKYFYEARTRYFYTCFGFFHLTVANLAWTSGWLWSHVRGLTYGSFNAQLPARGVLDIWTNYLCPAAPASRKA